MNPLLSAENYTSYLETQKAKLFEPLHKLDWRKTAFCRYILKTDIIYDDGNTLQLLPLRHEFKKSIAHHKARDITELFWLLKSEMKALRNKETLMTEGAINVYSILRSITNMRPECPRVQNFLIAYELAQLCDDSKNWIQLIQDNVWAKFKEAYKEAPSPKKVFKFSIKLFYVDKEHLDDEIIVSNTFELDEHCNACRKCQTTAYLLHYCACKKVFYCNETCQANDYPNHKDNCIRS